MKHLLKNAVRSTAITLAATTFMMATNRAEAAVITWGAGTTIANDTDVSTLGTLDRAINVGDTTNATVNGVTFLATGNSGAEASFTAQNTTFSDPTPSIFRQQFFSSTNAPFSALSADYRNLLDSGAYNNGANPMTVSLGALTSGQTYQVQVWVNDSRNSTRTETINGGGNTVTLDFNSTNADGGLGQFTLGTFTADSVNQAFTITNAGQSAQINALQVRNITGVAPVPEPGTYAMMFLGMGALGLTTWKRKRTANPEAESANEAI